MKIAFSGDISLNNRYATAEKGRFTNFELPVKTDYFIGNLECLVSGDKGVNPHKIPSLSTSKEAIYQLERFGFTHVALANNHIFDNLESGFLKTTTALDEMGIGYFGASLNSPNLPYLILENEENIKVGILNYVDKSTNPTPPSKTDINVSYFNLETLREDVKLLKKSCNYVVIYIHWGGKSENMLYPDADQLAKAKKLALTDADVIVGHHSHVIHPIVVEKGKYIYYSLGNFCFDNIYFNNRTTYLKKKNKKGLILHLEFGKTGIKHNVFGTKIDENGEINIVKAYKNQSFLFRMLSIFPPLLNLQFQFNYRILRPLKFLFRGNPISQLKKIDSKKIKSLFK